MKKKFFAAIEKGELPVIQAFLQKDMSLVNARFNEESALYKACATPHLAVVKMLLDFGADINWTDELGSSPLLNACFHQQKEIVAELLRRGADIKQISFYGGVLSCVKDTKLLKLLITAGADVNERSFADGEETPLFFACLGGRLDIVEILLESGADIDAKNDMGRTALWEVCLANDENTAEKIRALYPKVVEFLADHGADVSLHDECSSILSDACDTKLKSATQIVRILLKKMPREILFYKDCDGLTALDIAKKHKNKELIELLMEKMK
ncbi:MAG: ankyrin repeat domain-containing protein [Elusimicrobiaceae bacterium]|nr:ankyrin repeat domain-containing protein [Elusimicrobiaceae bacterium]